MGDDEFERMMQELREMCDAAMAERARQMFAEMHRTYETPIGDDQCVLLGFEGELDAVWSVPAPLPDVLYRPKMQRFGQLVAEIQADPREQMQRSQYRRIGEFTYQREA